jgi:hypothetical protein
MDEAGRKASPVKMTASEINAFSHLFMPITSLLFKQLLQKILMLPVFC